MNRFFYNLGYASTSAVLRTKDAAVSAARATGDAGESLVAGCAQSARDYNVATLPIIETIELHAVGA
jgi:hypothetical protein